MKIIITGASGLIGRKLVHHFSQEGHDLLLLGRNSDKLARLFPEHRVASYPNPEPKTLAGYDGCIHLATRNNNRPGTKGEFIRDNVEQLQVFCKILEEANIRNHIYISSILAHPNTSSTYGKSKWMAEQYLRQISDNNSDWRVTILRPAFIHMTPFRGKLACLNALPSSIAALTMQILSILRPIVHYKQFQDSITEALETYNTKLYRVVPLSNRQVGNIFYEGWCWLLDMLFVLTVITCFGWLFPILYLWIRQDSPGPVLFIQERVGRNGRIFRCYKFRTMKQDTKAAATHEISRTHVTGVGSFLRKSKIDELPQIWNIVRRDMSLIGPRPCLPIQTLLIKERRDRRVLDVLPGITGFAQVQNIDMSDPKRLAKVDADYIVRRTLVLDARILIKTFLGRGMRDYTS